MKSLLSENDVYCGSFVLKPEIIISCIAGYFVLLLLIAWISSRHSNNRSYFIGNKSSPWIAVAFGLIADSLSGVTFISLPGSVLNDQFSYMQMVIGYLFGYAFIAEVLLPVYYRMNLTSIYSYLHDRFGHFSQRTGSFYFLVSRTAGAALRLALTAGIMHFLLFGDQDVDLWVTVAITIGLMLLYTYKGGIKTLVWTDTLQSGILLLGVVLSVILIIQKLDLSVAETFEAVSESGYARIFYFDDWKSGSFFFKQFLSGAFIAIVMTGLDQNMMQKNLSMRTLKEAKKNIYAFSSVLIFVNLLFVSLGALLYVYASRNGLDLPINLKTGKVVTDEVFPFLAVEHLGMAAAIVFVLGLTAATFSSADSVLTTLTTSFMIDFMDSEKEGKYSEGRKTRVRHIVHIVFALILFLVILLSSHMEKTSIIRSIFTVASYTYGPLLGLFIFGLFTRLRVKDRFVPLVCIFPPFLCFLLHKNSEEWLGGYKFGYELLLLNGLFTFVGLLLITRHNDGQRDTHKGVGG